MTYRPVPAICGALLVGAALAAPARAQSGEGFLFREPTVSIGLRGGFGHASAGSDVFSFSTEQLTLGRDDFSGPSFGGQIGIRLHPRVDLVLDGGYVAAVSDSEMRDWVDTDDKPIEQTTRFQRAPLTANVKAYLVPRGRSIGSFAWVPSRLAPYVGAGAGAMWYRFQQEGDFVDYQTLAVFRDEMVSSGWAPTAQAFAGVDVALTPRLGFTGEMRYARAEAKLSDQFDQFDPIDLSGFAATVGLNIRF